MAISLQRYTGRLYTTDDKGDLVLIDGSEFSSNDNGQIQRSLCWKMGDEALALWVAGKGMKKYFVIVCSKEDSPDDIYWWSLHKIKYSGRGRHRKAEEFCYVGDQFRIGDEQISTIKRLLPRSK
jgi:hypothetical protein